MRRSIVANALRPAARYRAHRHRNDSCFFRQHRAHRATAPVVIAVPAGIVAGGMLLLGLIWSLLRISGASETQQRASGDDPGRTAVSSLMLNGSAIALFVAIVLVRTVRQAPLQERAILVALCLATVALAWSLTHSTFALRYAYLYYREDEEGVGGVEFPGGARPAYSDFAYLAFTIGMCFQVSDTSVTSSQIRRSVLLHAVISTAVHKTSSDVSRFAKTQHAERAPRKDFRPERPFGRFARFGGRFRSQHLTLL
jgi:uncharacterized membrane protein